MKESSLERNAAEEALAIAALGMECEDLKDLPDILGQVGDATDSFAVLLWELAPGGDLGDEGHPGQLFVLAHWLSNGDRFASHTLPLDSFTGRAIQEKGPSICHDVTKDKSVYQGPPAFMSEYEIRSFVSIRLKFGDAELGALNFYWKSGPPISETDVRFRLAKAFAQVLPGIFAGLREKSSLKMIRRLNASIQSFEGHAARLQLSTAREALHNMACTIRDGFRCLEVSIFLVRADVDPRIARLETTTLESYIRTREYPFGNPGITGWVLNKRKPVRIFDLASFERDRGAIESRYPGLTGFDLANLVEITRDELKVGDNDSMPPFSFVAVPILVGTDLLGVIRCCTPVNAPFYYSDRDEKLLMLAASQIGHCWNNWVQLVKINNEKRSWELLVTSMNDLISGVSSPGRQEEKAILEEFLQVAHDVIPGADICDVRLYRPKDKELYFAATYGKAWKGNKRAEDTFPVSGPSAGALVFKTGKPRLMHDVSQDELYNTLFGDVKSMVIVPVGTGNEEPYGVLDVRITTDLGIPPNAPTIAIALGRQLGLYLHLLRTLEKVKQAEVEREKILKTQTRVFEDLEHQLRLPVAQAHSRLSKLLAQEVAGSQIMSNAKAIGGLLRKADRVVRGMGHFVRLAKGQPLKPIPRRLHRGSLVRLLIEICMDCVFLEGVKSRGLSFYVNDATFGVLDLMTVECDPDLLEQAAYDIIDNACKYSFNFERILVVGGVDGGRFYISVMNKGLDLPEEDIARVTERGWRGPNALLATGQGSGIGCWFADQVMRAHGGRLRFFPTTPERVTEVRLQF